MKEDYFIEASLEKKAKSLRDEAVSAGEGQVVFSPAKSALIVLDMQKYFLDPNSHAYIPSVSAIIAGLVKLVEIYRARRLKAVLTRHINTDEDAAMLDRWWSDTIRRESPLSELDPRLAMNGIDILEKTQYDAFYSTTLEHDLKAKGITQIVVGGVMTHLCCETTARSAFVRGFEVFFLVDGTATYSEEHHRATLVNLAHGFAELVMVDELLDVLKTNDGN